MSACLCLCVLCVLCVYVCFVRLASLDETPEHGLPGAEESCSRCSGVTPRVSEAFGFVLAAFFGFVVVCFLCVCFVLLSFLLGVFFVCVFLSASCVYIICNMS